MLKEFNSLPEGILDLKAHQLYEVLQGSALIHLEGMRPTTLFVSVLLHGNEPVGWEAIRSLLKKYQPGGGSKKLPRNLSLFIGNTKAAAQKSRRLNGQVDFNRVWPGGELNCPESDMMQNVVKIIKEKKLFASLDIHNNTGMNPHYGCINKLDYRFFRLALLFRRLVIYFTKPEGVQSKALASLCPSVTIEAGKAGDKSGVTHTEQFIDECLHLHEISDSPLNHLDMDLFHTVATVKVSKDTDFGFSDEHDLLFNEKIDRYNFSELERNSAWATLSTGNIPLEVINEQGKNCTNEYFYNDNGVLKNKIDVMPAMLTLNENVIRQDCLCYLMERINYEDRCKLPLA